MPALTLKPGREKSLLRRHPWIFSGAVARVEGDPQPGATVDVLASGGQLLGRAAYSPSSQIRARLWSFDPSEPVDVELLRRRIHASLLARQALHLDQHTNAFRLVHAESDGLPGLIVDRYAGVLVTQFLSAGAEFWRQAIAGLLLEETGLTAIFERSDADVRELEGLPDRVGWLRGSLPLSPVTILENGLQFIVDLETGHKTGFYLDQRANRLQVRSLAEGRDVLDCFCYTGGFTVNALAGGAKSVLSVDASAPALELCLRNVALNAPSGSPHSVLEGDVFQLLRKFRDERRTFDLIVLDPPKFAPTAAQAEKAARGYKDINLLAFKLLRPGGLLVTCSCSGGVDAALFQKIVASAALDAGVDAQILFHLEQAPDHPVALHFPEGAYLKGLVCQRA
ncbi:MAG TPA: class I SAM-dependent rRNA methyltransferase [Anaerolineales bacterium]|nr:class I SAM-dependent rRNA methyltransferase [Anaerolineales bacterium]